METAIFGCWGDVQLRPRSGEEELQWLPQSQCELRNESELLSAMNQDTSSIFVCGYDLPYLQQVVQRCVDWQREVNSRSAMDLTREEEIQRLQQSHCELRNESELLSVLTTEENLRRVQQIQLLRNKLELLIYPDLTRDKILQRVQQLQSLRKRLELLIFPAMGYDVRYLHRLLQLCDDLQREVNSPSAMGYDLPYLHRLLPMCDDLQREVNSRSAMASIYHHLPHHRHRHHRRRRRCTSDISSREVMEPKLPQHDTLSKRKESFNNWPKDSPVEPHTLAEAGFVYTGFRDRVQCYHCGGCLKDWHEGEDPWIRHVQWYDTCGHVKMKKGQGFIDAVKERITSATDNIHAQEELSSTSEQQRLLSNPQANICIGLGYTDAAVWAAILQFRENNNGSLDFNALDIVKIILGEPERTINNNQAGGAGARSADSTNQNDTNTLNTENQRLRDSLVCEICLDEEATVTFMPCGHLVSCSDCATDLLHCPVCKTTLSEKVEAYSG